MIDRRESIDRRASSERRDYARVPLAASIRFLRSGIAAGEVLNAELRDVSCSGVRIMVDRPLIVGEALAIEVRDADQYCFNLTAHVVWSETNPADQHEVGCELRVELSRRQFAVLRRLVPVQA